jgi:septum formation protein
LHVIGQGDVDLRRKIILASGSIARRDMLRGAGLAFVVRPADVDEAGVKARATGTAAELALELACLKAAKISAQEPGAVVIGADQILVCEGKKFDKPEGVARASAQLRALRGRAHELVTAACVYRDGAKIWEDVATPRLVMRDFSEAFLADYLAREGDVVCGCVGAYRLEGLGVQLFERIEGDFFTILGLNLLPLLGFLRAAGLVPA